MKCEQQLYVSDVKQPKAYANSRQVNCQLETQEAFAVSCNNLPVPCSREKKTVLSSELIPRRLAVRDMEINKITIAIGRIRV